MEAEVEAEEGSWRECPAATSKNESTNSDEGANNSFIALVWFASVSADDGTAGKRLRVSAS